MKTIQNRIYESVVLGAEIRRSIAKDRTFRVRQGNGYYESILGETYQDQYDYFVPSSINNVESEPYRRQWIAAVHKWKYDLTDNEKEVYHKRTLKGLRMSGYNLFMREAMKGLVQMYVDRGDPATYDYAKEDLTIDGAFHDLDLSAIVPAGAKAVLIKAIITDDSTVSSLCIRKNGNVEAPGTQLEFTRIANVFKHCIFMVACDSNRIVELCATDTTWTTINLVIRGWWT